MHLSMVCPNIGCGKTHSIIFEHFSCPEDIFPTLRPTFSVQFLFLFEAFLTDFLIIFQNGRQNGDHYWCQNPFHSRAFWRKITFSNINCIDFTFPLTYIGKDIIGLAETGSGKTAAFTLPILQALLDNPQKLFALILTPTRELAFQISEQIEALGSGIGVKCGKYFECYHICQSASFLILW